MSNEDLIAEARTPHCKDCDHFMRAMADALEASERSLKRYKRMNPKRAVTKLREAEAVIAEALEPKNIGYGHMDIALDRVRVILSRYKPTNQEES